MPVQKSRDKNGCFARWGSSGHHYYYTCGNDAQREIAEKKALAQGVAIGEFSMEEDSKRVSFDFDNTLSKNSIQKLAEEYIKNGILVYVISARNSPIGIYPISDRLGIPRSRVYATGSNSNKIKKVRELKVGHHYDDNQDVVEKLGSIGKIIDSTSNRLRAIVNLMSSNKKN